MKHIDYTQISDRSTIIIYQTHQQYTYISFINYKNVHYKYISNTSTKHMYQTNRLYTYIIHINNKHISNTLTLYIYKE